MARILIAEDDRLMLELFERALVRDGHEVEVFGDGASACEALAERDFDAVVTDFHMPRGTGLDVVRAARARRPDVPIFVLSASARESDRLDALAAGARAVLQKPLDLRILCELIGKATMSEKELKGERAADEARTTTGPGVGPRGDRPESKTAGESSTFDLGPLAAPRVLVLEPEPSLRKLLEYCLKRQGLRVTATGDEKEALEMAALEPPDAAIAGGPEDDRRALAFVDGLRRDAACARTHVVFLYSEGAIADAVQALDLGADATLERPVEPEILFAQVRAGVRRGFRREAAVVKAAAPANGANGSAGNGHGHASNGNRMTRAGG